MPSALLRPCPAPHCEALTTGGLCPLHARTRAKTRASTSTRGYGYDWQVFRRWFHRHMIALGILPVCGAALPNGPAMQASQCKADGRLTDRRLHLDHEPPLTDPERGLSRAVCDPLRVGWLCHTCHTAKTNHERATA